MKSKIQNILKLFLADENNSRLLELNNVLSYKSLTSAFLILLSGQTNENYEKANSLLKQALKDASFKTIAQFYKSVIKFCFKEIEHSLKKDAYFKNKVENIFEKFTCHDNENLGEVQSEELNKHLWQIFFPEGEKIWGNENLQVQLLREKRKIEIKEINEHPLNDPGNQIIFTSNILLTIPNTSTPIQYLDLSETIKSELKKIIDEEQVYWYDHPVQIGVAPEKNEILYGLKNLNKAIQFEKKNGLMNPEGKVTCVLSISVTHRGLHKIANQYIKQEIDKIGGFDNLDIYVFSETGTKKIIEEILFPISNLYLNNNDKNLLKVFGVDGEYGRHYSFLKSIAALWNVFIDSEKKATFKIDLDQIFLQEKLVEETGKTAFEHFSTPLWGATGKNNWGNKVELGMIAGALVNHNEANKSLFTPDVKLPTKLPTGEEQVFFSLLPQAVSTQAEMMEKYDSAELDGKTNCLQRFHVTGGTNGILISALRKYKPFTPSFIGRAEDQAYIISIFNKKDFPMGYLHQAGLIMRHDKNNFAQEAIEDAKVGKIIGDYLRILYFSFYAKIVSENIYDLKKHLDPFTGCFITNVPLTIVMLRFSLKILKLFQEGKDNEAEALIENGEKRISEVFNLFNKTSNIKGKYFFEKKGWDLFYKILDFFEKNDNNLEEYKLKLVKIINEHKL